MEYREFIDNSLIDREEDGFTDTNPEEPNPVTEEEAPGKDPAEVDPKQASPEEKEGD